MGSGAQVHKYKYGFLFPGCGTYVHIHINASLALMPGMVWLVEVSCFEEERQVHTKAVEEKRNLKELKQWSCCCLSIMHVINMLANGLSTQLPTCLSTSLSPVCSHG